MDNKNFTTSYTVAIKVTPRDYAQEFVQESETGVFARDLTHAHSVAGTNLAAVGVGTGVGHGEHARLSVLELEVLIGEFLAVDGLATFKFK